MHTHVTQVACRVTECANSHFVLQRRKGHGAGGGLSSLLVGTLDTLLDTRPPPYRILLQCDRSDVSYQIAVALQRKDIGAHWDWLERNLMPSLGACPMLSCCRLCACTTERPVLQCISTATMLLTCTSTC